MKVMTLKAYTKATLSLVNSDTYYLTIQLVGARIDFALFVEKVNSIKRSFVNLGVI